MKKIFLALVVISLSIASNAQTPAALNLDVADQNFNSTDKIIIDQDEIRNSRASSLPALLATKANISISTNNVQPNSIYIRGGDSSHVLILVDGTPTYDASSPQRTLNLFNLNLSKIKRIEVLKGSQSVLYGGQAMSGVIKIETFDNKNETPKNQTSLIVESALTRNWASKQALSLDTIQNVSENVSVSGGLYGFNASNNSPVFDSEKVYPQKSGAADLAVQVRGNIENVVKLSYSKDDSAITNAVQATSKPYDTTDYKALIETSGLSWTLQKTELFSLTSSFLKVNRSFDQSAANNTAPPPFDGIVDQKYDGTLSNVRLDVNLLKTAEANLIAGAQLTTESILTKVNGVSSADTSTQYEGYYLKSDYKLPENFFFEYGVRQENSKSKSIASSYHVGLIWKDMIKVEYSTGFKTPSLFQLFSSYGNKDLLAEKSKNFSISAEHKYSDRLYTSLTYFDTQFENLIDYSFSLNKYLNISQTRTVGIESQSNLNFLDGALRFTLSLGYQEPKDLSKNLPSSPWLVRRPLQTGSFKIASDITSSLNAGSEVIYTGEKLDKSGTKFLNVEDYTLVNIFANIKLSDLQTYFARIENVENKNYQTTYGFYNQGSVYKLGAQLTF